MRTPKDVYRSQTPLEHLLPPQAYWQDDYHQRDLRVLRQAWHLVGTTDRLARPGDFLTCQLLGHPIQVRNFQNRLVALSNVCAHRHCLLSSEKFGHSPTMKCQYHGWEYSSQGRPCKIPAPKNFVPFPQPGPQLPKYRVECAGQLIFLCLEPEAPDLATFLGPVYSLCQQHFGSHWRRFAQWEIGYEANWKVPIENSLESYHVPSVHPQSFAEDPGEKASHHEFFPQGSAFFTSLPFGSRAIDHGFQACESQMISWLGGPVTNRYCQYQVFPHLLFSFTDAISFCQRLLPEGSQRSQALIVQLGRSSPSPWQGLLSQAWGRLKASLTQKIVEEDRGLFASIQKGLEGSPQRGILGRCEERVHAFQEYLQAAYEGILPSTANPG